MKSYVYKNNPQVIENSSSGGAFKRIISIIGLDENTIIYGVIWNENLTISHSYTGYREDLQQFSESKYSRSKMGDSFNNIASQLLEGKTVIFSGTPCQITGLKQFLKVKNISRDKLYLIDIICHGTPSPALLKEWIKSIENKYKHKIVAISFRDKEIGWKGYPTKILFSNGKIIRHTYKTQEFIRLFLSCKILGPSCYECPFSSMDRKSDITIGDFWGVENTYPEILPGKGVSLVLANTEKGIKILETIKNNKGEDEIIAECSTDSFLRYQHNLNRPSKKPVNRNEFWISYLNDGYDTTLRRFKFSTYRGWIKFNVKKILSKEHS